MLWTRSTYPLCVWCVPHLPTFTARTQTKALHAVVARNVTAVWSASGKTPTTTPPPCNQWNKTTSQLTAPDVKPLAACLGKSTPPLSPPPTLPDLCLRQEGGPLCADDATRETCPPDCRAIATPDTDRRPTCRAASTDRSRGNTPALGNQSSALAPDVAITLCS